MDTTALPADEQFAAWARHTPNTRVVPLKAGAFLARGSFWDLGSAAVAESVLDGFTAERDDKLIHATVADHFLLVALFGGDTRFQAEGIDTACGPGDAFICDFKRASLLTTNGIHCATVAMPRSFVEAATRKIVLHGPLPHGPETAFLVNSLAFLIEALPKLTRASAPFYARVIRDLLAAAVMGMPQQRSLEDASRRAMVLAYVEAQPPGTVSPAGMLDALNLTRSTLYRLFREEGGIMAYDRLRRLRQLHRELLDSPDKTGIAELGARYGFFDRSHLARLFRETFGYSMTDLKSRVHVFETASSDNAADKLREAVRRMAST